MGRARLALGRGRAFALSDSSAWRVGREAMTAALHEVSQIPHDSSPYIAKTPFEGWWSA